MRFRIKNTKENKTYDVDINDNKPEDDVAHKKTTDEKICKECNKPISQCQCQHDDLKEDAKESVELDKKEYEAFKELLELLPDLKKLLEKEEPKKEKEEEPEESEEAEEEKAEEEAKEKGDSEEPAQQEEIQNSEILYEESDDDKTIESEEFDLDEDDIFADDEAGDGENVKDSILNPGTIETNVSDSNKDTVSHEIQVAEAWNNRYDQLLKSKK